jgi:hypothetical protein
MCGASVSSRPVTLASLAAALSSVTASRSRRPLFSANTEEVAAFAAATPGSGLW